MTWDMKASLRKVAVLRACSARAWPSVCSADVRPLAAKKRAKRALAEGLMRSSKIDGRLVYSITDKGIARCVPQISRAWASENIATERFGYWRSEAWAALLAAGYRVSNEGAGVYAVRRYLLDALKAHGDADSEQRATLLRKTSALSVTFFVECACGYRDVFKRQVKCPRCKTNLGPPKVLNRPAHCAACGHISVVAGAVHATADGICNGVTRACPSAISYDVAYRRGHVVLVLADSPYRGVSTQLKGMPLALAGLQPRLDIMWVATDGTYDREELQVSFGRRTASLRRALVPARTAARRARQGLLPLNARLLMWCIVDLPEELLVHLPSPRRPEKIQALIRSAIAQPPSKEVARPRGRTFPVVVPLEEHDRERLLTLRGTFGPNLSLRAFLAALLTNQVTNQQTHQPVQRARA